MKTRNSLPILASVLLAASTSLAAPDPRCPAVPGEPKLVSVLVSCTNVQEKGLKLDCKVSDDRPEVHFCNKDTVRWDLSQDRNNNLVKAGAKLEILFYQPHPFKDGELGEDNDTQSAKGKGGWKGGVPRPDSAGDNEYAIIVRIGSGKDARASVKDPRIVVVP